MPRTPLPPVTIRAESVLNACESAGFAIDESLPARLAAALGVAESTVRRVLARRTEPSTRFVFELARLLDTKPEDLFTQA